MRRNRCYRKIQMKMRDKKKLGPSYLDLAMTGVVGCGESRL